MPDLQTQLRRLAAELDWPTTPALELELKPRRNDARPQLRPVWVVVAAAFVALAVALSVPTARSAILRVFHLGGVTVERVDVLPPAQERPLAATLGQLIDTQAAATALGAPVRLPTMNGSPRLYLHDGVVSLLLAAPQPLLLSEFRAGGFLLKKIASSGTTVVSLEVGTSPGLWIAGARHAVVIPAAPPRLAGNVLVWQHGATVYRLEGRGLTQQTALKLALQIQGT
jgi:hypothetical protein